MYNKLNCMEDPIKFLVTLLGLELDEIRGIKIGVLITPSLSNLLYRAP